MNDDDIDDFAPEISLRAIRRHHRMRLKKARRHHFSRDMENEPKTHSFIIDTPKPCSCFMCGNIRNFSGKTRQERRFSDKFKEDFLFVE
jgi:hypothetical protein